MKLKVKRLKLKVLDTKKAGNEILSLIAFFGLDSIHHLIFIFEYFRRKLQTGNKITTSVIA